LVLHEYADTVFANSTGSYFTGISEDGVVEGGDWYVILGGRQDYMTFFKQGREFTLELSRWQMTDAAYLPMFWDYNYNSLLLYIKQALYGVRGIITDAVTGNPIKVKVGIPGYDDDNSFVYSSMPVGNYHRLINEGTYDITYSKAGYESQTITTSVINYNTVVQDVALIPVGVVTTETVLSEVISLYPNPTNSSYTIIKFNSDLDDDVVISIYDSLGKLVFQNKENNIVNGTSIKLDLRNYKKEVYFLNIKSKKHNITHRLLKM